MSLTIRTRLGVLLGCLLVSAGSAVAQTPDARTEAEMDPLAVKEAMIRDRFKRFEDRVFRLREQLAEIEPGNAKRLARVLERAGELQLGDRLEQIVGLLDRAPSRDGAVKEQAEWLSDAERVLGILLERDSDNEERRDQIDKMRQFKEDVDNILGDQRDLRADSARAATARRMSVQLEQALRRVESLSRDQRKLPTEDASAETRAADQRDVSRDTKDLAEDLTKLAETAPPEELDSEALQSARQAAGEAAESSEGAAEAMSRAAQSLEQNKTPRPQDQQEAIERLEEARERLEKALERLEEEAKLAEQAPRQEGLSDRTQDLHNRMKEEGSPQGSQPGTPGQGTPGEAPLDQAQREMDDAQESLEQDAPDEAVPKQDRAIEELNQAQKELDEALTQLRKEERAEMLRDLEVRFREMLSKQRAINESTVTLHEFGRSNFTRAEELQVADLAMKQRELSDSASACLHILDEDGTTVVFPRVVEQAAADMSTVADRLSELLLGALTQQVQRDIVDTLEQLLGSVQRMQQENEQQDGSGEAGDSQDQPLLPTSAELKLLRSSQHRVNERTAAIESAKADPAESPEELRKATDDLADRQKELSSVATEMRDRQQQP